VIPKAVETDADLAAGPIPAPVAARVLPDGRWFTYLYVASWFSHKNHEVLFSALEQLRRSNVPIRLVVSIEPELLHSETAEVRRLVLEGRIVPVGWVAKEWLRALYNAADGCLMPSLIESLSSSHLEAMQWGKPQIVSDLPYAHALCGDAAIYASPEDPTAWSGEMLRLREDVALRERLVAAGRRRMEMMPNSWTQVAMKARSFLEEVSRSGRPRDMAACGREL
jgi:glycosyltransferase involved in cell wall biosynthesis